METGFCFHWGSQNYWYPLFFLVEAIFHRDQQHFSNSLCSYTTRSYLSHKLAWSAICVYAFLQLCVHLDVWMESVLTEMSAHVMMAGQASPAMKKQIQKQVISRLLILFIGWLYQLVYVYTERQESEGSSTAVIVGVVVGVVVGIIILIIVVVIVVAVVISKRKEHNKRSEL